MKDGGRRGGECGGRAVRPAGGDVGGAGETECPPPERGLPNSLDRILGNQAVAGDDGKAFFQSLGDEQAVEGVAVDGGRRKHEQQHMGVEQITHHMYSEKSSMGSSKSGAM